MCNLNEEAKFYGEVFNSWEELEIGLKEQFDSSKCFNMKFNSKIIIIFHSLGITEYFLSNRNA